METKFVVIEDYQSANGLSYLSVDDLIKVLPTGLVMIGTKQECSDFLNQYTVDKPYELI